MKNPVILTVVCSLIFMLVGCGKNRHQDALVVSTPQPTITRSDQPDVLKPYTTCQFSNGLAAVQVDRLPGVGTRYRTVKTAQGVKQISMTDGCRVMLSFPVTAYFANLKVETSEPSMYADDKQASIQEMEHVIEKAGKTKAEIEHRQVGKVEVYGSNNPTIEVNGPISEYLLFNDGQHAIVTIYILNQAKESRRFQTMEEYKRLKEQFLKEYIQCMNGAT